VSKQSLVHVAAICAAEDMHTPSKLFGSYSQKTETTELVFRVDMPSLLAANLSEASAAQQAVRLLKGLVLRQLTAQVSGSAAQPDLPMATRTQLNGATAGEEPGYYFGCLRSWVIGGQAGRDRSHPLLLPQL